MKCMYDHIQLVILKHQHKKYINTQHNHTTYTTIIQHTHQINRLTISVNGREAWLAKEAFCLHSPVKTSDWCVNNQQYIHYICIHTPINRLTFVNAAASGVAVAADGGLGGVEVGRRRPWCANVQARVVPSACG